MECKYVGPARKIKRGSTGAEVFAWLVFPFGLPYTVWRMVTKRKVCRNCGSEMLVPVESPTGQRLVAIMEKELAGEKPAAPMPEETIPPVKEEPILPPESEKPAPAERDKSAQDPNEW